MKEQIVIQQLLRKRLADAQVSNPQYSLRAFAKKVGIHFGALSSILNGKRNVSRDLAERIVTRLMLDPQERAETLELFPVKRARDLKTTVEQGLVLNARYRQLSAQQFKLIAEWEHFALLSLMRTDDFQSSADWISKRLGITVPRAHQVVDRLIEIGILSLGSNGELTRIEENLRTTDDLADISVKKGHEQTLELAKASLYRDSVDVRDFTHITFAVDPEKLSMAKEMIRQFQWDLLTKLDTGKKTEVYRVSMQMFPLSQVSELEKKI